METDTVEFHATAVGTHLLADTAHNYNNVLASTTVNPSINISVGGIPTLLHRHGLAVAAGDATTPIPYTTGTFENGTTQHANYINITTPINAVAGETAQTGFNTAMGPLGADQRDRPSPISRVVSMTLRPRRRSLEP